MRTRPTLVCSLGVALALGLFASCGDDKSPTQPTPVPVPTPTTVDARHGVWATIREAVRGTEIDYTTAPVGRAVILLAEMSELGRR